MPLPSQAGKYVGRIIVLFLCTISPVFNKILLTLELNKTLGIYGSCIFIFLTNNFVGFKVEALCSQDS